MRLVAKNSTNTMINHCLLLQLAMLLSPTLLNHSLAFSLQAGGHSARTTPAMTRSPSALKYSSQLDDDDESEWYSPSTAARATPTFTPIPFAAQNARPLIRQLDSKADHLDFIAPADKDNRLSVVLFHASWCKTCLKVLQHYKKMATQVADYVDTDSGTTVRPGSIRLATLEYSQHTALCQEIGVVKLPTMHLYRDGAKVASLSCGANQFARVKQVIMDFEANQQLASSHAELQSLAAVGDKMQQAIQDGMSSNVVPLPEEATKDAASPSSNP